MADGLVIPGAVDFSFGAMPHDGSPWRPLPASYAIAAIEEFADAGYPFTAFDVLDHPATVARRRAAKVLHRYLRLQGALREVALLH